MISDAPGYTRSMRATKALIHLENLRHNIRQVRKLVGPGVKMCMAVKANAYGHGAVPVSRTAVEEGVDFLGIATIDEGIELRTEGISTPVILLSIPDPGEIPEIVEHDISCVAADREFIRKVNKEAESRSKKVNIHLKIDTGMGRIGCSPEDAADLAVAAAGSAHCELEGVFTHFPVSDEKDGTRTRNQLSLFNRAVKSIQERGIHPGLVHAANSGAVISLKESHLDMARPGIILYGYYPSKDQERILDLKPVMELDSKIIFLKNVPPGTGISYGLKYYTDRETTIATVPVGYGDGYSRLLSNKAEVCIRGKRYPVSGTICMDQCMVDLGQSHEASLFDRVTLFGPQKEAPDAEDLADLIDTIPYEITCWINQRVPRVYLD